MNPLLDDGSACSVLAIITVHAQSPPAIHVMRGSWGEGGAFFRLIISGTPKVDDLFCMTAQTEPSVILPSTSGCVGKAVQILGVDASA